MKKITLLFFAISLCLTSFAAAEEARGGGSMPVSPRLQSLGVRSMPRTYSNRAQLFNGGNSRNLGMPSYGPNGGSFRANFVSPRSMSSVSVRNNMTLVNNANFRAQVVNYNVHENTVGRYYWHSYGGNNFCHYYDRWGCNWYGWYFGSSFYWSCWWGNNWWWYDPVYYRWCYWHDGWWWWQNPDNVEVVYVYNNGEYVPANQDQAQLSQGAPQVSAGTSAPQIKSFSSKDGTRMVKLAGDSNDAFLYDTTGTPAFSAKYLASGVKDVHFSNTQNGKPLQIMLGLTDGSFELYDANGNSVGGQ